MTLDFAAVVLAGERPGGSDFSRQLGLASSVLVDVAGKTALARVIEALESSRCVNGGVLCGPVAEIFQGQPKFREILAGRSFRWIPPQAGPSASALAGLDSLNHYPALLTAGDHALLTGAMIDDFCSRASGLEDDIVFGLVPYAIVRETYPESKRTVLKFSNGQFCGSNLFAILKPRGKAGPALWSRLEADRKRPWRMVRHGGVGLLLKYLTGRLTLQSALQTLSRAMGCQVGYVLIDNPRAAIDVDSVADRDLAEKILKGDRS